MRRFLFDWHLRLGQFAGTLILIWSASGALMTLDPVVRRAFDAEPPKVKGAPVDGARFTYPVSRLPVVGVSAVALRTFAGRSWYEARWPDGRVAGFDAATGAPVPAEITADEARDRIAKVLPSKWTVLGIDTLTANDDHYRPTDFPAYRLALAGPGAPVLYLSSRDGSVLKSTTRWSRGVRWLGMGVHTWNPEALKRAFDTPRRLALAALVALPLFLLALISYALLYRRREEARAKPGLSKRVAALVAAALIAGAPRPTSAQAIARVVMPRLGMSFASPIVAPALSASILPATVLGAPSLSVTLPALASPALVGSVSAAPVAAAAVLAAARPLDAHAAVSSVPAPPQSSAVDTHVPLESQVSGARVVFDGIALKEEGSPVPAAAFTPHPSGLSAASVPERPSAPEAAKSTAPRGPDRKALWGIYLTHGAHLFTMSAAWRVAWPLLVIDLAGKASLAAIGSAAALVEMGTGLVAGMIVDRLLPRKSMAGAAVARAVIAVALYAAASAGGAGFPLLFGAFLAHSFALTTIHIGQSSAAPAAAGDAPGALRRVNSILKIVTAAVSIPGSLLGGWAVASMGVPGALLAYAAANVLVLAPLYFWLMPNMAAAAPAVPAASAKPESMRAPGLWEAAKLIFTSRILLGALIAMAAGVVLVEPLRSTTLPILASDLSPASAAMMLGGFQAAFYTGQFAGNFGLLKWGEKLSNRSWILLGAAGLLAFGLFALAPVHIAFAFAAAALIGLLTQPLSVVAKTAFQEEVRRLRPDLLGRAMGVNNLFYRLAVSAGTALVGWAAVSGAALALGAAGTLAAVYGGVAVALVASTLWLMRRMGDKK